MNTPDQNRRLSSEKQKRMKQNGDEEQKNIKPVYKRSNRSALKGRRTL